MSSKLDLQPERSASDDVPGADPGVALLAEIVPASCVDGPGNRFVVFFQGCNFDCLACHNPHTIPRRKVGASFPASVDEVVARLREAAPFVSGVTASGGEATLQSEFLLRLFERITTDPELARLTTLVDSNGNAPIDVWDRLAPRMDGAMIDLKAFDPELHLALTRRPNDQVLASIRHLASIGKLYEVRLLLIPGVNDGADELVAIARWLRGVDPSVRVRINGFRRDGTRLLASGFPEATGTSLIAAVEVLAAHGLDPDRIAVSPQPDTGESSEEPTPPRPIRS